MKSSAESLCHNYSTVIPTKVGTHAYADGFAEVPACAGMTKSGFN